MGTRDELVAVFSERDARQQPASSEAETEQILGLV